LITQNAEVQSPQARRVHLPLKSILCFITGAVVLRGLSICAWAFFPGHDVFPQLARIVIPLLVLLGLVLLNRHFLERDGFSSNALGLNLRRVHWLFGGMLLIVPIILAIAGALRMIVPFRWVSGALSWEQLGWQAAEYFAGNSGEELMFRGYLLLVLTRRLGTNWAMLIVAVLFGLFHLPGLSGSTALKMICTTAAGSYLFAYGFLLTGSLWTAIGMHAFGNLLLHQVLGMGGGNSILKIELRGTWPSNYDPAFLAWLGVCIPITIGVSLLHRWMRSKQSAPREAPFLSSPSDPAG
jgi:membrane protease YdiL (CAAX protease family)